MKRREALFLGLLLTCAQIAIALCLAPQASGFARRYHLLNNWDSKHYSSIARDGYHLLSDDRPISAITSDDVHESRANVGFFPAYPMSARALVLGLGMDEGSALLVVSHLACWLFWFYFLAILFEWGFSKRAALVCGMSVALYPTAFYLVTGYSESLFMASLLGFVYWTERALRSRKIRGETTDWAIAGLHGFVLTATRLVGIPLIAYPMIRVLTQRKRWLSASSTAAFAALGVGAFFGFCQWRFGAWNLYIALQQKGWGNLPDYLALFKPMSYLPHFFFEDTMDSISRASVPAILVFGVWIGWKDFRYGWTAENRARLGLYALAFLMFYVALSGKANAKMDSMSRYTFPVYVLLILIWAEMKKTVAFSSLTRGQIATAVGAFVLQAWMTYLFLRGHWVA